MELGLEILISIGVQEPWEAVKSDIKKAANFYLPPVTFQMANSGSSRRSLNMNKQIYRVEMR